jgi:hypothetical protein
MRCADLDGITADGTINGYRHNDLAFKFHLSKEKDARKEMGVLSYVVSDAGYPSKNERRTNAPLVCRKRIASC